MKKKIRGTTSSMIFDFDICYLLHVNENQISISFTSKSIKYIFYIEYV